MTVLSGESRQAKLHALAREFGHPSVEKLLEVAVTDSVAPAICVQDGCNFTTVMEPDQRDGYCELCGGRTVQSALVLAGVI